MNKTPFVWISAIVTIVSFLVVMTMFAGCSLAYESAGVNKAIGDYYFPAETNAVVVADLKEPQDGKKDQRTKVRTVPK